MRCQQSLLTAFVVTTVVGCAIPGRSAMDGVRAESQLTQAGTGFYQEVSWAPDGSALTVSILEEADTTEGFRYRVHLLTLEPLRLAALTAGPMDLWTSWAPDGHHIAYTCRSGDASDICVMNADGSGRTSLTDHPAADFQPDWSPDGKRIAFVSGRGGTEDVYVMNADGSGQTPIGDAAKDAQNPVWSPDGRRIAYYETDATGNDEIYVMNSDGTGRRLLAKGVWPSWFPDGSKLLFGTQEGLFAVNLDGTGRSLLVPGAEFGTLSPDGTRLACIKTDDGLVTVYTMNADGTGAVPVLARAAPAW